MADNELWLNRKAKWGVRDFLSFKYGQQSNEST